MISQVFITYAVTGGGSVSTSPHVPVTPEQIADPAIEARGAVVQLHVRGSRDQAGSRNPALFREVVQRIPEWNVNPMIKVGAGSDVTPGGSDSPLPPNPVVAHRATVGYAEHPWEPPAQPRQAIVAHEPARPRHLRPRWRTPRVCFGFNLCQSQKEGAV